jgi:hypothetical protein
MTRIITEAPQPGQEDEYVPPRRPDGLWFGHMMDHDGRFIFADTFTELVGAIIDGYDDIPRTPEGDEEAWIQRYLHAVSVATVLQANINAQAAQKEELARCTPEQIDALFRDRREPFTGIAGNLHWDCPVPLILIDAHYVPVDKERPAPTGRVDYFYMDGEDQFIMSLDRFGLVGYGFREGEDVGEPYESEVMDDEDYFGRDPNG